MGCDCCKWLKRRSAGGQLEQPSDVNNSTSTGVRGDSAVAIAADIIIIHQVRIYDSCTGRKKTSHDVPGQRLSIDFDSEPRPLRQEPVAAIELDGLAHDLRAKR